MKRIKLTDRLSPYGDVTMLDALKVLAEKFPDGFSSSQATIFLKRKYRPLGINFRTSLSKPLVGSNYISRENHSLFGPKYKYHINLDKINLSNSGLDIGTIVSAYDNIITPKLKNGSLRQQLLDDLKLTLIEYLNQKE